MTEHIEDWLKRLVDPGACENEKERTVTGAVRSGLRAAEPETQADQIALQRLHKHLASQGLYDDAAVVRSRRVQLFGYAAVLLLGVSIILNYAVSDRPLHEAALTLSKNSGSKSESYSKQILETQGSTVNEEREFAQLSDAIAADETPAQMASRAKPQALASAPEAQYQRAYGASESAGDMTASKSPVLKKSRSPIKLSLATSQWQLLAGLNHEGISLANTDTDGLWILVLNSKAGKAQWQAALPKRYKQEDWLINVDIEIQLVIDDD